MKKLIIAEKPSLARNIIAAIGTAKCKKADGYYESDDYIVTWAFGHLFSLLDLDEYDADYDPDARHTWTLDGLPFYPVKFRFSLRKDYKTKKVDSGVKKQFNTIKTLMERSDVSTVINAGDSDREGEIIVRIILQAAKNKKPVERLWMPDQTPETIGSELKSVRSDSEYDQLANEGYARTYIDWLYGINLTRYASIKSGKLLRVGRVTSPIVKAIYDKDMAIKNFKPEKYYTATSKEKTNGEVVELSSKKEFGKDERDKAQELCKKYNDAKTLVKSANKERKIVPPGKLYSLSKLQGVLGKEYKLSPQQSLDAVQKLYEAGYVTYPRTNTEYLATAEKGKVQSVIKKVGETGYPVKFKDSKSIFDDSKIESHSALTPTTKIPKSGTLSATEQNVYDVILKRFVAVFCAENCEVDRTTIVIDNGYETFTLKGDIIINPGWTKYDINEKKEKTLPKLSEGDTVSVDFKPIEKETVPPKHYSVDAFNGFLKNPFKEEKRKHDSGDDSAEQDNDDSEPSGDDSSGSDDEDYKAIMNGAELGTEATRAGLIDAAIKSNYIELKNNLYYITEMGIYYVETLEKLFIDMSKYKTVKLGMTLKSVYKGDITIDEGLSVAKDEITDVFSHKDEMKIETFNDNVEICKCPKCGSSIMENARAYACQNKDCGVVIFKNDKFFSTFGKTVPASLAKILFTRDKIKITGLKSPKTGNRFDAVVKVEFDGKYPKYQLIFDEPSNEEIGVCPKCGKKVKETAKTFSCENKECGFTLWKEDKFLGYMGKKITKEIAKSFLENGQAYIRGMKSKKTGKSFDATVKVDFSGKYPKYEMLFDK